MPGFAFCLDGDSVSRNDGCILLCDTGSHNKDIEMRRHLDSIDCLWILSSMDVSWHVCFFYLDGLRHPGMIL